MAKSTTTQQVTETKVQELAVQEVKQEVAKPQDKALTPIQRFQKNLEAYETSILPSLLKKHNIEPDQFKYIVLSEIKKSEKLLQAFIENPSSMFASILAGAEIGLIPSEMLGEFYLITRRIDNKMTVTPQVGYKGMVNLLLRGEDISKVDTKVVYESDIFEVEYGFEDKIIHKPNFAGIRNAETLTFVYAVAKLKSGDYQFCVLSKGDILKIQAMSKYNNELYFNDKKDPNMWMVRKIALMQLAKMLPKDFYGKKALELENSLEGGAMLVLDENNEVKIVDGKKIVTTKYASVKNTLNQLPDIPE